MLLFLLAVVNTAHGSQEVYYSIHFASLKNLQAVNQQINSLKEKGKMVFWERIERPGIGSFFRVYVGRYPDWDQALAFREKLKASGVEGPLGIQWFSKAFEEQKEAEPPRLIVSKKPDTIIPAPPPRDPNRFVDNEDGTITDTRTNLMWIKNGWRLEFISALPWFEALDKCKNFTDGKYTDWRLPTIEEWSTLIDITNQNPALVEPNPFVNIISHMPYWSNSEFTYGQNHTCTTRCPFDSYTVMLWSGRIAHQKKSKRAFIMPVRTIAPVKIN